MLLSKDDPPPFEVTDGVADSPYVITCDHGSRRIPRALGSLGLPESELERHIAWDIGAAALSRKLARTLGAWLIVQNYSRLVIDCNRRPDRPDSIATVSDETQIPGNQALSAADAQRRVEQIFEPYHERIRRELDAREARGSATSVLFVHSFTPVMRAVPRPWQAGVLYNADSRLALKVLTALRADPALTVGENEPYAAGVLTDYGLVEHAERRGLPYVELEVRQDLLSSEAGVTDWAARLARALGH